MRCKQKWLPAMLIVWVGLMSLPPASPAATRFYAYNETTAADFTELYLAPAGSTSWGPNQTLNDKDKSLDHSERLTLSGVDPGVYDVKLVDSKGRTCIMRGVDLTAKRSFDIRDQSLAGCR